MRLIGSVPDAIQAERFVSYLLTHRIEAVKEPANRDGSGDFEIWIRDEDAVDRAREELREFTVSPTSPKYADAVSEAKKIRRAQQEQIKQAAKLRKTLPAEVTPGTGARRMSGTTFFLGLVALVVTLATDFGKDRAPAARRGDPAVQGEASSLTDKLYFVSPQDYARSNQDPLASLKRGEVWRLFSPAFLHLAPMHLMFNLLAMLSLGSLCESLLGRNRYLVLILVTHLTGTLAQALMPLAWQGYPFFGGLSGVVYGLFGYLWIRPMFQPSLPQLLAPLGIVIMIGWLAAGWYPAAGIKMANWAHLGGLLGGIFMAMVMPTRWGRG